MPSSRQAIRRWTATAGAASARLAVPFRNKLFIGNEWRDAESGRTFTVSDPSTEEPLFECARASVADVDAAVKSAKQCFYSSGDKWGKLSSGEMRGAVLRKFAAGLRKRHEEFSVLEALDNGKPVAEARADMDTCISIFEFYAGLAESFDTHKVKHIQTQDTDFEVRQVQEPVGVVGLVTPWNFPLLQAAVKVAPAIAAGCSMILKPSSVCPATCLRLGDLAVEAGLPPGALNIVTGTGSEAGSALLDHPSVARLSFTGSSNVGHAVMHAAAKRLVPVAMELGGKGAVVVFDDVDIEAAIDWVMVGIFVCTGQTCSATSRLIIHRSIEAKFLERLSAEATKLKMGDPLEESTQLGPLTSADQLRLVSGFVDRARAEGGEVICGGTTVPGKGYYYPATAVKTPPDSEAWREEIFGPVLAVASFETEEEAVALANDTPYGLGNAVISNDADRCERVAQQLHAGIVWKNCSNAIPVEAPFGGFGKSGFGKEYGEMGFEEYLQTKVITAVKPGYSWEWYVKKN